MQNNVLFPRVNTLIYVVIKYTAYYIYSSYPLVEIWPEFIKLKDEHRIGLTDKTVI